jgi:tetratricopeptide (TPR) repeat protein
LSYYNDGEFQVAHEYMREATRVDPSFGVAWIYQAMVLYALRQEDLAFPAIQHAFAVREKLNGRHRHHAEALYYVANGDYGRAHEKYRILAGLYPDEAYPQRHLAQSYALLLMPEYELQFARKAVDLDNRSAMNQSIFISALADNSMWDDARAAYEKASRLIPNSAVLVCAKGYVHLLQSEVDPALECSELASRQADMYRMARTQMAKARLLGGRLTDARDQLELDLPQMMVQKDVINEGVFRYFLGQALAVTGEKERAIEQATVLAERPVHPLSLTPLQAATELAWRTESVGMLRGIVTKLRQIAQMHQSSRSDGILHQASGLLAAMEGSPSVGLTLLARARADWPDLSITSMYAELLMEQRKFAEALPLAKRLAQAKASALRFDSVVLWVCGLRMAAECASAMGNETDEATFRAEYRRHWGDVKPQGFRV